MIKDENNNEATTIAEVPENEEEIKEGMIFPMSDQKIENTKDMCILLNVLAYLFLFSSLSGMFYFMDSFSENIFKYLFMTLLPILVVTVFILGLSTIIKILLSIENNSRKRKY